MKQIVIIISIFSSLNTVIYGQCNSATALHATNINFYNVDLNWDTSGTSAHHYRVRYKIDGSANWAYKNNIDYSDVSTQLVNLTPLSNYIWQIKSYCDSASSISSNWSPVDSFTTNTNSCPNTNYLFTTNINYNNATANWDTVANANRYKLRYRMLGTTTWSNIGPITHPNNQTMIPVLQQNTTYEWSVMTYHDSTSLLGSLWSITDTFTTPSFIAAPFNPVILNSLSTLQCNSPSSLSLEVSQLSNEPDVGTTVITSDGGYFNLNSLNVGDSVGYALIMNTTQSIYSTLRIGLTNNQNYSIVNSYDSIGDLIGFFIIENTSSGIKVSSSSPNDGNNYTSGFNSTVSFTNIFVNPPNAGELHFFTDITSELNDQVYLTDTFQVWCSSSSSSIKPLKKQIVSIYNSLGKKTKIQHNKLLFYKHSDGTIKKKIIMQ